MIRNRSIMHILPAAMATALVAVACSKTPGDVLPPEKMAQLMADVYRGESVIEFTPAKYNNDSMRKVVKQSVLIAHGVDQARFDSSMVWYGHHIEEYIKVCDRAVEILEAQAEAIPDDPSGINQLMVAGDSAQVWALPTFYHVNASTPSRYIAFKVTPDDNWEQGDEYTLAFKAYNMRSPINSSIAADYDNGTTDYNSTRLNDEGWSRVMLKLDTTQTASVVYGFIEYNPDGDEDIYIDSISLIRTRLNPNTLHFRRPGKTLDRERKD